MLLNISDIIPEAVTSFIGDEAQSLQPLEGIIAKVAPLIIQDSFVLGLGFLVVIAAMFVITIFRLLSITHFFLRLGLCLLAVLCFVPFVIFLKMPVDSQLNIQGPRANSQRGAGISPTESAGWGDDDELDFLSELNMDKYRLQRRLIGRAYTANFMQEIEGNLDKILAKNIDIMTQRACHIEDVDYIANFSLPVSNKYPYSLKLIWLKRLRLPASSDFRGIEGTPPRLILS